jgi:uncharacterized membrane protein YeaQ/YmgE (transglycosylase-associated protein family)
VTVLQFVGLLVVAGIAGALGQAIAGYSHRGVLVSIALGFVGALLGSWLARVLGLPEILGVRIGNETFPVVWSIIGAVLFVVLLGFLSRSSKRRSKAA